MSQDQDKTEEPTQHRLEEARQRGEVAKSADVSGIAVMIAFAVTAAITAGWIATSLAHATRRMIALAGRGPMLDDALASWVGAVYAPVLRALTPLVLALLVASVLGVILQTGPLVTTFPLKPDAKRMNPAQIVKRVFSMRTLWEIGKLGMKMSLLIAICALFAWQARGLAEAVAGVLPQRLGTMFAATFVKASLYVLPLLGAVALADLLFVRRDHGKRMRMSRRELRDEVKRRDGDPAVKSKQKQQIRDLLKKTRALSRVGDADVVVTNPTHVAVALRYRPGETRAPVILAKGAGFLSRRIRILAARHGVPVMRSPALARALYKECDIDGPVPEQHYLGLAPIYRELWAAAKDKAR
jgi:flagellar biosynthetic protein FlhB